MASQRLRILTAAALVGCTIVAVTTQTWADITVENFFGLYTPVAFPPSDPESVALSPSQVVPIGPQSVNFQNLMNNFADGYYSGTGDFAGNGHSINYNPDPLNGTLRIREYQALSGERTRESHT